MERYHAHRLAAHLGAPKVLHRIRQRFTWPGMRKDIFSLEIILKGKLKMSPK